MPASSSQVPVGPADGRLAAASAHDVGQLAGTGCRDEEQPDHAEPGHGGAQQALRTDTDGSSIEALIPLVFRNKRSGDWHLCRPSAEPRLA
ncbi:hypothetical protein AB0K71_29000 [Streptomyces syringium]|uniref:hypothetical protein n=1 Tax=Streptomyces syringium TaxID=76729 RepID=UPI00342B004B